MDAKKEHAEAVAALDRLVGELLEERERRRRVEAALKIQRDISIAKQKRLDEISSMCNAEGIGTASPVLDVAALIEENRRLRKERGDVADQLDAYKKRCIEAEQSARVRIEILERIAEICHHAGSNQPTYVGMVRELAKRLREATVGDPTLSPWRRKPLIDMSSRRYTASKVFDIIRMFSQARDYREMQARPGDFDIPFDEYQKRIKEGEMASITLRQLGLDPELGFEAYDFGV